MQHFGLSLLEAELRLKGVLDDYDFTFASTLEILCLPKLFLGGVATNSPPSHTKTEQRKCVTAAAGTVCVLCEWTVA